MSLRVKVNFDFSMISETMTGNYLEEINNDVFNGDTTIEDLVQLQKYLGIYIHQMKAAIEARNLAISQGVRY